MLVYAFARLGTPAMQNTVRYAPNEFSMPRIYTSTVPSVPVLSTSIFTRLFSSPDPSIIGGYPASASAFIDSDSGITLTRAQTKRLALSLAYGLRNHPTTLARRGDVIMIFAPNCLSWPIVLFASSQCKNSPSSCSYLRSSSQVAAGLRCTLANSAYTPKELAFQYGDSGAKLVFTNEEGVPTVLAALEQLGISRTQGLKRIIVLEAGLGWAGALVASRKPKVTQLLCMQDLLQQGSLDEEEKFEGQDCHETAYLCYSSGTTTSFFFSHV